MGHGNNINTWNSIAEIKFIKDTQSTHSYAKSIFFTQLTHTLEAGQPNSQTLKEYISTSDNGPVNAKLKAVDEVGNVPTWLTVNGKVLNGINYTTGSSIIFNFDATNLSVGTYTAIVYVGYPGYNYGAVDIFFTVKQSSQLITLK